MNQIPNTDHVSRYCPKKQITSDGRVTGAAFQLRHLDNGLLSVNWNEKLGGTSRDQEIEALSVIYAGKMKKTTGSSIVVLNVGKTKNYVLENSDDKRSLDFFHDPTTDESHASIRNIKLENDIVPELIAETVIEKYKIG